MRIISVISLSMYMCIWIYIISFNISITCINKAYIFSYTLTRLRNINNNSIQNDIFLPSSNLNISILNFLKIEKLNHWLINL